MAAGSLLLLGSSMASFDDDQRTAFRSGIAAALDMNRIKKLFLFVINVYNAPGNSLISAGAEVPARRP